VCHRKPLRQMEELGALRPTAPWPLTSPSSPGKGSTYQEKIPPWIENHSVIRVLLVFANPNGTHPLRLQAEEKCIREALRQGEHGDRVVIDVLAACTIDELARKLMSSSYEIIHFSGHADRTATLLKHIVEILQKDYHVDHSSFHSRVKSDLAATAETLVQELEAELIRGISSEIVSPQPSQVSHVYHGDFTKTISLIDGQSLATPHESQASLVHRNQPNIDFQIPLTIRELPVRLRARSAEEEKVSEITPLTFTRNYSFHELVGIGVGSLAFENEGGGVNFMCPLSFAKLVSETCPPLQCVILNACAGHIQAEILSRVIPLTICFTGRVSDKESIMFSRGFYESIASGRAIDDAFKDGSRRVEIHSLSSGMPNRHGPGVNSFCNLSTGTPLMSLIRNSALLERVVFPQSCALSCPVSQSPPLDRMLQHRLDQLEKDNQQLSAENNELKSLIQYGMGLLKAKDQTVGELKDTLAEILATVKGSEKPRRGQRPGGELILQISSGKRGSNPEGPRGGSARKGKTASEKVPQKRRSLNYHHVKSSGYGRRSVSIPTAPQRKVQAVTRASSPATLPSNIVSARSPRHREAPPSPSRIPLSQRKGDETSRREEGVSVLEADSQSPPPLFKGKAKAMQSSSQIPVLKSRPSPQLPSPSVQQDSTVVIKPTAWSKSYQNYDDPLKTEILRASETSDKRPSSVPITNHQVPTAAATVRYPNRSSAGWREFLHERREVAARLKPSSSFASAVPRFDPNNASSIDGLL
jgi:hypothetical protein